MRPRPHCAQNMTCVRADAEPPLPPCGREREWGVAFEGNGVATIFKRGCGHASHPHPDLSRRGRGGTVPPDFRGNATSLVRIQQTLQSLLLITRRCVPRQGPEQPASTLNQGSRTASLPLRFALRAQHRPDASGCGCGQGFGPQRQASQRCSCPRGPVAPSALGCWAPPPGPGPCRSLAWPAAARGSPRRFH